MLLGHVMKWRRAELRKWFDQDNLALLMEAELEMEVEYYYR